MLWATQAATKTGTRINAESADDADIFRLCRRAFGVRVVCVVRVPFSGQVSENSAYPLTTDP